MVLSRLAFVGFLSSLRSQLSDGDSYAVTFGNLFTAVAPVGVMVRATIPGSEVFENTPVPAGGLAPRFDQPG